MQAFTKRIRVLAAHALVAASALAAFDAAAAPVFTVNPNANGGLLTSNGGSFEATAINGFSSLRLVNTGATNYTANGYIVFNGFSLNSVPVSTSLSRVNLDYGLYATFTQTFNCSGILAPGVKCQPSSLTLDLYGDPGNDNSYQVASVGADPTVTKSGAQVLLASANVVYEGEGGLSDQGGAYQNVNMNWLMTAEGKNYFAAPIPFYSASFAAFNNTSQGLTCDVANCAGAKIVAITSEAGILDFNGKQVPEPGALALLGIGLLGLIAARRQSLI